MRPLISKSLIIPCFSVLVLQLSNAEEASSDLQPERGRPEARERGDREMRMLDRFDKDGDGELSKEERSELHQDLRAGFKKRRGEFIEKHDLDEDGKLSENERQEATRNRGGSSRDIFGNKRRKKPLDLFDADGDGKLSEEEGEKARAFKDEENRQIGEALKNLRKFFLKKYDTDGDGEISEVERAVVKQTIKANWADKKSQMLELYDADGDGELSEEEHAKARDEKRAAFIKEFDADGDGEFNPQEQMTAFQSLLKNDPAELMMMLRHREKSGEGRSRRKDHPEPSELHEGGRRKKQGR